MTTPSWYIIPSQRLWARWFNLLHWPLTLWHLSYVVLGAGLATQLNWQILGWTVLAFFLGMGICSHAMDLVKGDPLRLGFNPITLMVVGSVSIGFAVFIGGYLMVFGIVSPWLIFLLPLGVALALGYGLEWWKLHGDWQFAAWWGVFPLLVGYLFQEITWHPALFPLALFAFCTAYAQRALSTRSRFLRRQVDAMIIRLTTREVRHVQMNLEKDSGSAIAWLLGPLDRGMQWFGWGMVVLALAVLGRHI